MINIFLACPYNGLRSIKQSLMRYSATIRVIDSSDLSHVTSQTLCVGDNEWIPFASIHCAFIRYPYDLIPPHTESFKKREDTEFLKTLALLLDHVSPNKIATSWSIRNRMYSIELAKSFGVPVPSQSEIHLANNKNLYSQISRQMIFKSLGNCFFSWSPSEIPTSCRDFFKVEEDDGEYAVIIPAQMVSRGAENIIKECGLFFSQTLIPTFSELRFYIIGSKYFCYERKIISGIDQSGAEYAITSIKLPLKLTDSLKAFQDHIGLSYCCYDIIMDKDYQFTVIDINPFGSLPPYDKFQDVTDSLADYIANYGNRNAQQSHVPNADSITLHSCR